MYIKVKRALDVIISSILLIIFAIPMLIVAITIKLEDGGPIVNNYSLKLDINIIFKTFSVLFCKEGTDEGKGIILNYLELLKNKNIINDVNTTKDELEII